MAVVGASVSFTSPYFRAFAKKDNDVFDDQTVAPRGLKGSTVQYGFHLQGIFYLNMSSNATS